MFTDETLSRDVGSSLEKTFIELSHSENSAIRSRYGFFVPLRQPVSGSLQVTPTILG